uniref:Retinal outer segment membrane protein 1a n=1 Tax=Takifugu rubripes TaxID=31033 RepID=A0A674MAF6_TAKRU
MVVMKMKFPFQKRVKLAQGLWLLSWGATVAGALTFSLGCILKTELRRRAEVMDNSDIHIVPNTLMIVGVASLGINYFASKICQDALDAGRFPRWKTFLKPYFAISSFFTVLMLLAVIMSYVMKGSLESSLKVGLRNGLRFYKDTDTPGRCFQKQNIDRLQMEFQCCGNSDFKDWFEVQWISNRYLDFSSKEVKDRVKSNVDGRYLVDGVPFSCCNPSLPRPCLQRSPAQLLHGPDEHPLGGGKLLIHCLEVLRFLQTSMEAVAGNENTEIETEGYLLEKGVKETIKEYTDPVLKFLLLKNQVRRIPPTLPPADVPATT